MTEPTTHTLEVPGATLTYDIRKNDSTTEPPLFLIGTPMGASGFPTLAGHFADRTVITYDPRGIERSTKDDPSTESTPDQHADDVHRIIEAIGLGPVDLFASSGGAVNALALVTRYPEDVRTVVAHEPPVARYLPDSKEAMVAVEDIRDTYQRKGMGAGMAKFIAIVSHNGPITAEYNAAPDPDPAMFGLPTEDDGSRNDALLHQNLMNLNNYEIDFDALRATSSHLILAAGVESEGTLACRSAIAIAERLGTEPVMFPSDHGGFFGGEYGQQGKPDAFAAKLREVLATAPEVAVAGR